MAITPERVLQIASECRDFARKFETGEAAVIDANGNILPEHSAEWAQLNLDAALGFERTAEFLKQQSDR